MKRHVTVCATVVAVAALASAVPAAADYRIPLFPCSIGVAGANLVPANTPLYFDGGWTTGNRGLVQDAINDAVFSFTDTRAGVTTARTVEWGPIMQDNFIFAGSWTASFRVDFPPLAVGETATLTRTLGWAHPLVDLGLPTSNSGSGLLYFDLQPAGSSAFPGNPTTCTITGV